MPTNATQKSDVQLLRETAIAERSTDPKLLALQDALPKILTCRWHAASFEQSQGESGSSTRCYLEERSNVLQDPAIQELLKEALKIAHAAQVKADPVNEITAETLIDYLAETASASRYPSLPGLLAFAEVRAQAPELSKATFACRPSED